MKTKASYKPGQSGNLGGRPTKAEQALRLAKQGELEAVMMSLQMAVPKALRLMITTMNDPQTSMATRLKLAEKIFQQYVAAKKLHETVNRPQSASITEGDEEVESQGPVVLQLTLPK